MNGKKGMSWRGLTKGGLDPDHGHMCCRRSDDGPLFEYRTAIRTIDRDNLTRLSVALRQWENVRASRIFPTGD